METKVSAGLAGVCLIEDMGGGVREGGNHVKGGWVWKRGGRRKDELRRTKGDI
jgi:hypothetical protein